MKQKLSNLEEYYNELQDCAAYAMPPFYSLSDNEKDFHETSKEFRSYLRRGAWTEGLIIVCLVIVPILVVLGAIYLDSQR